MTRVEMLQTSNPAYSTSAGPYGPRLSDTSPVDRRADAEGRPLVSGGPVPGQDDLAAAARVRLALGPGGQVVVVTGVAPDDGANQLTARIAAAMAAIEHGSVLAIDGDIQHPGLHSSFEAPKTPGLLNLFDGTAELPEALHATERPNLFVMPVGESVHSSASLLTGGRAGSVLSAIRQRFRYAFIAGGVITANPDGLLFASWADGIIAALAAGVRRKQEFDDFREQIEKLRLKLIGAVLTKGGSK